jgi:hypothetical protein
MAREEKYGGPWLFWLIFLALAALAVVMFVPYKYEAGYLDVRGGRIRLVTKYFGIKMPESIKDSNLSKLYKQCIGEPLPPPDWRMDSDSVDGLFMKERGDGFLLEDFDALDSIINDYNGNIYSFAADNDAWRAILTTFMDLLQDPFGKRHRGINKVFVYQLQTLRDRKGKPLTTKDIPSAGDIRKSVAEQDRKMEQQYKKH